ncbi:MAG TPA: c-type cytochrome [Longimicrobiales bacterium]|nr:c-type cytochrome [Longimicrobiales bacterium]
MKQLRVLIHIIAPALMLASCGGGEQAAQDDNPEPPVAAGSDLTPFQTEHGIGPITEPVSLEAPDEELAEQGEALFQLKCSACHRLDERYIGPPLGGVLDRRTPAYVMNMMLNPTEMTQKHPEAKALLAEYLAPMPSQDLTREEARALLEYLRLADASD